MVGKLVFAYGTLRRGDSRFELPSFLEMVHEEAYLEGFQMYQLGGFPGLMPGPGRARGEVHLYSTFDELDSIEGFRKDRPESSLFLRQSVMVECPTIKELQASVYVFNGRAGAKRNVIESGDWFNR